MQLASWLPTNCLLNTLHTYVESERANEDVRRPHKGKNEKIRLALTATYIVFSTSLFLSPSPTQSYFYFQLVYVHVSEVFCGQKPRTEVFNGAQNPAWNLREANHV